MRFVGSRLVRFVLVFLIVSFAVSQLVRLTPGSPAEAIAGESATPEVVRAVEARYGFDESPVEQWLDWLKDVTTGDFGESYASKQPVFETLRQRLPVTAELTIMSLLLSLLMVIPLALYAAYRKGSWIDRAVNMWSSVVISVPSFVIALVLVSLFALTFPIFPVSNWVPLTENPFENLRSALLPAFTLGLVESAVLLPVLRADTVSTLEQDYITLARSKGISSTRLLLRHALRPSSISLVTLVGLSLARLFGGTVIVEYVFNLPGIGSSLINSIRSKDLVVTQGLVMFIAVVYLVANFVVDVLYSRLDPRVGDR